jgi:hypothetical protein
MVEIKSVADIIKEISPYYKEKGGPEAEHKLVYDSSSETLEPVYFYIIDLMNDLGFKIEKLVDNFSSSVGSGHFSELGQRATIMQQQGAKILGDVNTVLRSVLNIVYDLKEFRIRLQTYDDLKSKDKKKSEGAKYSLKQIWMDKVDINKGNSSIKAMALGQAGFQTLIDAFLIVNDEKLKGPDGKELDLNDRVKRIVQQRISEYNIWIKQSEMELRKRFELEKTYLKSQVNALKLYTRWAKPYLKAASQLETKDFGRDPALVKVFNTLLLELTLLGAREIKVKESALEGDLPREFTREGFIKSLKRKYHVCVLVDFVFRGIPQRAGQQFHYVFGGKVDVIFRGYVLNDDEINKIKEVLDKSDLSTALSLVEGTTEESLSQIEEEINFYLEERDESKEEKSDESNPFLALFGFYNKSDSKSSGKKEKKEIIVAKDSWVEKAHLRRLGSEKAVEDAFKVFETYKKSHDMPAYT